MWGMTVAINNVLKKKYKIKFSMSLILKKIKTAKTILKKNHIKKS
jgi:3-hydroxyisobutyrate dehydrogenase-like beta-hydroxyacid dehydrogenase